MDVILDSNGLYWSAVEPDRLTPVAFEVITSLTNIVYVSIASVWELGIKYSLGKLDIRTGESFDIVMDEVIRRLHFTLLPIEFEDVATVIGLPFHHRDPFDRIIIAQAIQRQLPIVTSDAAFDAYPIQRLW